MMQRCVQSGGNWKQLYVVLMPDTINTYSDQSMQNSLGDLALSENMSVVREVEVQGNAKNSILALQFPRPNHKQIYFRCKDEASKHFWIEAMNHLCEISNVILANRNAEENEKLAKFQEELKAQNKFQVALPEGIKAGEMLTVDIPEGLVGAGATVTFPVPPGGSEGQLVTVAAPLEGRGGALDADHETKNMVQQHLKEAAIKMEKEKLEAYHKIFDSLDEDGGGTLDVAELRNAFTQMGIELTDAEFDEVILEADADGNGELDFEEFKTVLDNRIKHDNEGQGDYSGQGGMWTTLVQQQVGATHGLDLAKLAGFMHSKAGSLYKQPRKGNILTKATSSGGWKERFFVLANGVVQYFKDEADTSPQGRIELTADCVAKLTTIAPNSFCIQTPGGATELRSSSQVDADEWVAAIQGAISHLNKAALLMGPVEKAAYQIEDRVYDVEFSSEDYEDGLQIEFSKRRHWAIVQASKRETVAAGSALDSVNEQGCSTCDYKTALGRCRAGVQSGQVLRLRFRAAPTKAGELMKQSSQKAGHAKSLSDKLGALRSTMKNWKNRFFVLDCGLLSYFTAEGGAQKGEIDLRRCTISLLTAEETDGLENCFQILNIGGSIVLQAASEDERLEWAAMITRAAGVVNGKLLSEWKWKDANTAEEAAANVSDDVEARARSRTAANLGGFVERAGPKRPLFGGKEGGGEWTTAATTHGAKHMVMEDEGLDFDEDFGDDDWGAETDML
jgi:calmodulin